MSALQGPASWEANRNDVGWLILGTVWSSVFTTIAALAGADGNDGVAAAFGTLAGLAALSALIAVTQIGWRLAFGKIRMPVIPQPDPVAAVEPSAPGTPSVRIINEPARRRSDAWVMVGLTVGIALAVVVVGLVVVAARG